MIIQSKAYAASWLNTTLETCGSISEVASFSSSLNCLVDGFKSIPCFSFGSRNGDSIAFLGEWVGVKGLADSWRGSDHNLIETVCGIGAAGLQIAPLEDVESALARDSRVQCAADQLVELFGRALHAGIDCQA